MAASVLSGIHMTGVVETDGGEQALAFHLQFNTDPPMTLHLDILLLFVIRNLITHP